MLRANFCCHCLDIDEEAWADCVSLYPNKIQLNLNVCY